MAMDLPSDPLQLLLGEGMSEARAKEIIRTTNKWQIRKHVLERPAHRVEPWRCPVHGCLIEISYCLDCRIDQHRKLKRMGKMLRIKNGDK